jgi:alpha-ketoglutarate-dependent taurine dioxygenase
MILFRNLDIGDIPPTPSNLLETFDTKKASSLLLEYAKGFGHPIGYLQEQRGQIVQNIFPIRRQAEHQISSSSKVNLELHTETAFHAYIPDYLLLLCLRGDSNAGTTYSLLSDILKDIHVGIVEILKKNLFKTSIDDSFRLNGEDDYFTTVPVISRDINNRYIMKYDRTVMTGTTTEAQMALNVFTKAIERNTQTVFLKAGDLLVLDNNITVHGRTAFEAKYDGTDRWVQRTVVRKEINSIKNKTTCPSTGYTVITKYKEDDSE